MSDPERHESKREQIKERGKGYMTIVATASTFILLMTISSAISLYFLKLSIQPDVVQTIASASERQFTTTAWQIFSAIILSVNAIVSVIAYQKFKVWFRVHDTKKKQPEHFELKLWPLVGMGFLDALAIGVLTAFILGTNTSLHGLDAVSIYHALKSGQIYGIMSVLISLPIVGYVIAFLGPNAYHYIERYEKEHKVLGKFDIPDPKNKDKKDSEPETTLK